MKNTILLTIVIGFLCPPTGFAQLTVNATVSGEVLTNNHSSCTDRVITTTVTGGSGNYLYMYAKDPGSPGADIVSVSTAKYVVNPQPAVKTKYHIIALDLVSGMIGTTTALINQPKPINDFNNQFWSNVFTPNGDGVNDIFYPILPLDKNVDALTGVYRAKLQVAKPDGFVFLNDDIDWVNQDQYPIKYKHIFWNGQLNNVGGRGYTGTYFYTLTLYNCNYPGGKEFKKYTTLIR